MSDEREIMTQVEARAKAAELRSQGVAAIALPVPAGAWSGTERGWEVLRLAEVGEREA